MYKSILMSFQMIYVVYHLKWKWSSLLIWYQRQLLSLRPYTTWQLLSLRSWRYNFSNYLIIVSLSKMFHRKELLLYLCRRMVERCSFNYWELNKVIVRNKYHFPPIDDLFEQIQGACIFSKNDFMSRYHQLRVMGEDVPKTTFQPRYKHFELFCDAISLTNAFAAFMNLINRVFKPYFEHYVVVFIVDILVYSKSKEEHKHLSIILKTLRDKELYAKLKKCDFCLIEFILLDMW